jgi:hypothetical protein
MWKERLTAKAFGNENNLGIALDVPFTSCAFAAVDDDTSTPEIAAMHNNIAAPVPTKPLCTVETRLLVVVDLCSRYKGIADGHNLI